MEVLKVGRDSVVRLDRGREFQRRGAERLKALSPIGDQRAEGAESREEEEDRRERERERVRLEDSERNGGARLWRALKVRRRILKFMRCWTGSQCSCLRVGVMCSGVGFW